MIPKHPEFEQAQAALPFGMRFLNVGEPFFACGCWVWLDGHWEEIKWTRIKLYCPYVTSALMYTKADAEHAPHGYRLLQAGEECSVSDLCYYGGQWNIMRGCIGGPYIPRFNFPRARKRGATLFGPGAAGIAKALRDEMRGLISSRPDEKLFVTAHPGGVSFTSEKTSVGIGAGNWQPPAGWRKLERHEDVNFGDYVHDSIGIAWGPVFDSTVVNYFRSEGHFPTATYYRKEEPKWPAIFEYVGRNGGTPGELALVNAKGDGMVVASKDPHYPVGHVYHDMIRGAYNLNKWWKRRDDLRSFYIKLDK